MDDDIFIKRIRERLIEDRYSLIRKIGEGSFGKVYLAKDVETGKEVALKLEIDAAEGSFLKQENFFYEDIDSQPGFPQRLCHGHVDYIGVLAMELLGPNLEDLLDYCGGTFSLKTTLMLADQMLQRLETLHNAKIVHRDLKPSNFTLGRGKNGNMVHLLDFGIAWGLPPEREGDCEPKESTEIASGLMGTATYASIAGHTQSRAISRRDDLESLGYVLVSFLKGHLPWEGLQTRQHKEFYEMKMATAPKRLCNGLETEFEEYFDYVGSLTASQRPNYERLRRKFRNVATRAGIEYDYVFDWTIKFVTEEMELENDTKMVSSTEQGLVEGNASKQAAIKPKRRKQPVRKQSLPQTQPPKRKQPDREKHSKRRKLLKRGKSAIG